MRFGVFALMVWLFSVPQAWARSAGPDPGHAGDPPAYSTCLDCHGDGTLNTHAAVLTVSAPVRYVPGTAYSVTVVMSNPQSVTNGFETIARRPSGDFAVAGALASTNMDTQVDSSGYAKHTALGNSATAWTLSWTAPSAGFGAVRFYAAGNATNNNNQDDTGDWIETATANVAENLPPSAPSRNAPAGVNPVVATATPQLSVNAASDGNGDALTYVFQTCADSGCATVLETSSPFAGGGATVAWTPSVAGAENEQVYWRCRANDGYVNGPYLAVASYWVDALPEAPGAPALEQPVTASTVYSANPLIVVSATSDPDPFDSVDYEFTLASDAAFTSVVTYATHVAASAGQAAWQVPTALTGGAAYYVLVQGVDLLGTRGPAAYASFTVDLTHMPPSTPTALSPNGVAVTAGTPLLSAAPATGTGTLTYDFDLDVGGAFSPALRSAAGVTVPAWTAPGPALADGPYQWRIRAYDGVAYGNYAFASFTIDAVNDPPGAPAPQDPLDGAQVNTRGPTLRAGEAVDPEGDPLAYRFEVATNVGFTPMLQASPAVLPATDGTVSWSPALANATAYYWRVRAQDGADAAVVGPFSTTFQFQVVNANLPPGAPRLADGKQAAADAVVFSAVAPADPDGDPLTLRYEVYADSNLTVPVTATAGVPANGAAWTPAVEWTPGTFYWRAQAADAYSAGPWSASAKRVLTGTFPWRYRTLPAVIKTHREATGCAAGGVGATAWLWLALVPLAGLRLRRRAFVGLALVLFAACGDERTVRESVPAKADLAAVQAIFDASCIGCHGGPKPEAGMSLEAGHLAADLIGQPPKNAVALDRKWLRVAPGKPAQSFLMYKVTQPPLGGGDRMPLRGAVLDDDAVEVLRRWIAGGARME